LDIHTSRFVGPTEWAMKTVTNVRQARKRN
jgi:hypothetical protein